MSIFSWHTYSRMLYGCLEVVMEIKDWAKLQEELLKAQIGVIHNYLRSAEPGGQERKVPQAKSRSHISIIADLLSAASSPLHVSEIILRGRNAGYPAPPAQSRSCGFPALRFLGCTRFRVKRAAFKHIFACWLQLCAATLSLHGRVSGQIAARWNSYACLLFDWAI